MPTAAPGVAQTLQPKLEVLEAAWARLHTITGAETPDDVIAYWEGAALPLVACNVCLSTFSNLTAPQYM